MITNKEKSFVSAVVYVHDNADTIAFFLQRLYDTLDAHFEKHEIICVNDGSADESVDIIKGFGKNLSSNILTIVNMSFYQGQEAAMNAGIDLAIGDFVYEFDSNYIDYDIDVIMALYFHLLKGYDIVAASNAKKRFTSNLFYRLYNLSAKTQYKLGTETFRILSRRAINRIHAMSKTIPYRKALYSNCGLKIDTITYTPQKYYKATHARHQKKYRQDTALNTLILFTDIAYKISILLTVIMMFATLAGGVYTLVIYALGRPVAGYTTTMLVLTGSFFGVFAILAIVIKYLSLLVDLVFMKQKYIIESIEKIA